jgi:uncharacterized membrane protein YwzB
LQIAFIYYLPESPRYLASKGRVEEARSVLRKYHCGDDEDKAGALLEFELAEIQYTVEADRNREANSWLDFIRTSANRRRLLIVLFIPVMTQFSGNAVLTYFLPLVLDAQGITSSKRQLVLNGGISVYNFGLACLSTCLVNLAGRRRLFLFSSSAMLCVFIVWTALSAQNQLDNFKNQSISQAILVMIFLYWFSYCMGMISITSVYQTEVVPYYLRAKGWVLNQLSLSCILIFNNFVTPIAMENISWKFYIVFCVVLAIQIVVEYFFFPETKGLSLEEVAKVFGDESLPVQSS